MERGNYKRNNTDGITRIQLQVITYSADAVSVQLGGRRNRFGKRFVLTLTKIRAPLPCGNHTCRFLAAEETVCGQGSHKLLRESAVQSSLFQVRIRRIRPVATWLLALPMIAAGATLTAIMFWPLLHGLKGEISGYPPALVICGLVVPFVARKRYSLEIQLVRGTFRWTPPILIDQASRISTLNFFGTLADAFGNAGVHVVDERVGDVSPPQAAH